ncbi:RluA family pseudouridine synthase [Streptococcus dentiloxodontae]
MIYTFTVHRSCQVKTFLKEHDVSKSLLAKIKFGGGHIWINGEEQFATYPVHAGDLVSIEIPNEAPHHNLAPIPFDLDIVYEDEHFLVLNKPYGYASIPSVNHSNTIANFVKYYYMSKGYPNQQVHIVTRLDKDTSGLMLFAKHGYAHARIDKQLQTKSIEKRYYALVAGDAELKKQGEIIAPIARDGDSIITRHVDKSGKYAHTSYRLLDDYGPVKLVDIRLHTGRTHQIRVHFAYIGLPLLGDDLYGGSLEHGITRQALHCHHLAFVNPFSKEKMVFRSNLTDDFENVIIDLQNK